MPNDDGTQTPATNLSKFKSSIELSDGAEPILLRPYEYGWELCWQVNRKGEKEWAPSKWYPTINRALDAIAEFKLRNSDFKTLKELMERVAEIRSEMVQLYTVQK